VSRAKNNPDARPLRTWIRLVLSALVLVLLFTLVDPSTILNAMRSADGTLVGIATLLVPFSIILTVAVWWLLLRAIDPEVSVWSATGAVMAGYAFAVITPARLGEPAARIYYHRHLGKARLVSAFAVQGIYRTATYVAGGAVAMGVALGASVLEPSTWQVVYLISIAASVVLGLLAMFPRAILSRLVTFGVFARLQDAFDFAERLTPKATSTLLVVSTIRYLNSVLQFALLLAAMGVDASRQLLAAGAAFVFFIKSFVPNLFFTDLGIREGAAALFFSEVGNTSAEAVAAALVLFGLNAVLPALLGIPAVWLRNSSQKTDL